MSTTKSGRLTGYEIDGKFVNMKPAPTYVFATFAPGEVSLITGLSAATLQNWRKRGLLPSTEDGHPRLNTIEVAALLARGAFRRVGMPVPDAKVVGAVLAKDIVGYALLNWENARRVKGTIEAVSAFEEKFDSSIIERIFKFDGFYMRRYWIFMPDGKNVVVADFEETMEEESIEVAYVLNAEKLGDRLARLSDKPLVSIVL